jgi:hypothetical protein
MCIRWLFFLKLPVVCLIEHYVVASGDTSISSCVYCRHYMTIKPRYYVMNFKIYALNSTACFIDSSESVEIESGGRLKSVKYCSRYIVFHSIKIRKTIFRRTMTLK